MRSTTRDRSNHRSVTFRAVTACVLILLFAVSAPQVLANTAEYYVSEDGTSLSAKITLVNQSSYILSGLGLLGDDVGLEAENVTLTAGNGTVIAYEMKGSTEMAFPAGDYTLTYTAQLKDNTVYAKYAAPYNVSVFLPAGLTTDHKILGNIEGGGELIFIQDSETYDKVVVWEEKQVIHMRFYSESMEPYFYLFVLVWAVIFAVFGLRYLHLRKKAGEY